MDLYDNLWEEERSAYLYSVIAAHEENPVRKKLFEDLQKTALRQASVWHKKLESSGLPPAKKFRPDMRTRLVAWLCNFFSIESMHYILSAMKIRGMSVYTENTEPHREQKHTSLKTASNIRAAVFGVNDGLLSNMSLILGVAGANVNQHFIILTGIAGLLAGACSMGAGEYVSVRSQREVFEYQIAIEKEELEEYPEEEMQELSLIYQARGIPEEEANKLAKLMIENPMTGLNTLAREELGINPADMVSPLGAMLSSFVAFAIGAILPLIPFLFSDSPLNLVISGGLTAFMLFLIGCILSLFTNRNPFLQGIRMLAIGVIAGAITYSIGKWLGVGQI